MPTTAPPDHIRRPARRAPVAFFNYPGAFSRGCTTEACHFRDINAELTAAGASVVGISGDRVAQQARFAQTFGLGFPLLSDEGSKIARASA